jgi:1,4-dihydroxy-2-naphthoate octaprenyltransferase
MSTNNLNLTAWFWSTRPFSLSASTTPVIVGTAVATEMATVNWTIFMLAFVGSIAIQIATNLTDEYSDHRRYGSTGKYLAPHKVIQRGLLSETAVLIGMASTFGIGTACGLAIVAMTGWPILLIGLPSIAVAYFYSAGPKPIGDAWLGEVTVFVFMGPLMVMSSYYIQTLSISWSAFGTSIPVGLLVTAILHCNNLRDIREDSETGKRTLAKVMGTNAGRWLYIALLTCAYLSVATLCVSGLIHPFGWFGLLSVPLAISTVRLLRIADERRIMNRVMVRTGILHAISGGTLALGIAIGSFM